MKLKTITICCLLILTGLLSAIETVNAQTTVYRITGMVADSATRKAPDYITINLKKGDSVIKAVITQADGSFTFTGLKRITYTITFSAIGYRTKSIIATPTGAITNLGNIVMRTESNQLKEIVVTANKPIIKQEIDRISYDLQADPDSKINSVLEMLKKVPMVSVDADENIQLKGNTNYKIFINGKPSGIMDQNAKNVLRSMPASTIQRIEVITTPPAKYDAEGLGGIINIITNKKIDNGYSGSVNINGHAPGGGGVGTSFTIKDGKLGVSGFGGGSLDRSPITTTQNSRLTTGSNPTSLAQQGSAKSNSNNGYFGTEISYELDSLNLLSGAFNTNSYKGYGNNSQTSALNGFAGLLQGYNLFNNYNNTGKGFDGALNYQLGFKADKSKLLTFSYRYSDYRNTTANDQQSTNRVNYTTPDYDQYNPTSATEQTLQVDYVKTLKKWNIEAGVKGILRDNRSDFQYRALNTATNQFVLDPALSNNYNSTQDIVAAYNTWQYGGKQWGVKFGARIEQTYTDADFVSADNKVHQNYLNFIPSLALNWDINKTSGLNLGFTQRLKRPSIYRLNPFVDRSNPYFQSSGNPALRRVVINDITLTYHTAKKASLNVSVIADYGKDIDLQVSDFDPVTNITTTTYQNVGTVSALGSSINFNYPITKKWSFSVNSNVLRFWLNGFVNGVLQNNNFWAINISSSTGYNFDKGWRVGASIDIHGRNPTGLQGSSNGFVGSAFNLNKQLVKNKLSFSASVRNPFNQYRYSRTETSGTGFTQTLVNQNIFRTFNASLNYNFGKLKDGVKKTRREIRNDDN